MPPKTPISQLQAKKPQSSSQKYTVIRDGKKYSLTEEQYQKWLAYPNRVTIGGKNFNLSDKELERYRNDIETKGRKETHKTWLQQQLDRRVDQQQKLFKKRHHDWSEIEKIFRNDKSNLLKKGGLIKKSKVKKKNKKKAPIKKRRTRRKTKA